MEPFVLKKLLRFRALFPWNFGVPRDIWLKPNFDPVSTNSDLFQTIFCRTDLTYFHLFRPILPGGPDLFSPLFGTILFHNKAPWAGHLRDERFQFSESSNLLKGPDLFNERSFP